MNDRDKGNTSPRATLLHRWRKCCSDSGRDMMNVGLISSYLSHTGRSQIFFPSTQERKGIVGRTRGQDVAVLPGFRNNLSDKIICIAAARRVLQLSKHRDRNSSTLSKPRSLRRCQGNDIPNPRDPHSRTGN